MSRVRYGQSGYVGCSKSVRAYAAERDGRLPLTYAKRLVAREHGCTQVVASAALELLHDGEWHHTGKYARQTAYFSTDDSRLAGVIAHIIACGGVAPWRDRQRTLRAQRAAIDIRHDGSRYYQFVSAECGERLCKRRNWLRLQRELSVARATNDVHAIRYACFLLGESSPNFCERDRYAALAIELTGEDSYGRS